MTRSGQFTIPADHPALPGHFPGRPVVPGVVLLDHVIASLLAAHPGCRAAGLPAVKFRRPVQPGERVDILTAAPERGRVPFACRVGPDEVASGTILLAEA